MVAGSVSLAVCLAGCSDGTEPDPSSEAFTGPLTTDLIVVRASTECGNGRIGPGDTVRVNGADYVPDAVVTLRWSVASAQATGRFSTVTADEKGEFTEDVRITRDMADPGQMITISSDGSGESGLMTLTSEFEMGDC